MLMVSIHRCTVTQLTQFTLHSYCFAMLVFTVIIIAISCITSVSSITVHIHQYFKDGQKINYSHINYKAMTVSPMLHNAA